HAAKAPRRLRPGPCDVPPSTWKRTAVDGRSAACRAGLGRRQPGYKGTLTLCFYSAFMPDEETSKKSPSPGRVSPIVPMVIACGMFMNQLDSTIIATSIPQIAE